MLQPAEHGSVLTADAATAAERAEELQRTLAEAELQREMVREGLDLATAARLARTLLRSPLAH